MPNNRPEILPRLDGANMPLGESFSLMQQTGRVPVPGMPGAGSRLWGVQTGRSGLESRGPAWLLCDLGRCLGPGFLCKMGVIIPASQGGGIK